MTDKEYRILKRLAPNAKVYKRGKRMVAAIEVARIADITSAMANKRCRSWVEGSLTWSELFRRSHRLPPTGQEDTASLLDKIPGPTKFEQEHEAELAGKPWNRY